MEYKQTLFLIKEILFLIIVFLIGLYLILVNTLPRYEYIDDQTPDLLRFNKITGILEVCKDGEHWHRVVSKSIVKVERPTISYDDFMERRRGFQDFLKEIDELKK